MQFSKSLRSLLITGSMAVLAVGLIASTAQAQAVPSATRANHELWAGGEYSNIGAGFPYESNRRLWGVGAFADYRLRSHLNLEAEARFLRFNSFHGETEDNYLAGPRYIAQDFGRLQPFAQCLLGIGKIQYPFQIGSGSYLAVAPAAGANFRLGNRLSLRGEYEYQLWLNSPNIIGVPSHEITPNGFHVGIAFKVWQ